MPLDPAAESLLALVNQPDAPKISEQSPDEVRTAMAALQALLGYEGAADRTTTVARDIDGVPCQIITPAGNPPDRSSLPVLVWFHGGGWVIGSANESLPCCR